MIKTTTSKGNPAILVDSFKYRKAGPVSTGDIVWRCLARNCCASVRTDAEIVMLKSRTGTHNHEKIDMNTPPASSRNFSVSNTHDSSITSKSPENSLNSLPENLMPFVDISSKLDSELSESLHEEVSASNDGVRVIKSAAFELSVKDSSSECCPHLLQEIHELKETLKKRLIEWEAAVDRAADMETRLNEFSVKCRCRKSRVDVSCNTVNNYVAEIDLPKSVSVNENVSTLKEKIKNHKLEIEGLSDQIKKMMTTIETLEADNLCLRNTITENASAASRLTWSNPNVKSTSNMTYASVTKQNKVIKGNTVSYSRYSVYLWADSQGRKMRDLIWERLPVGYSCEAYVAPGATFEIISNEMLSCSRRHNLGLNDWVFVIAGTNSVSNNFKKSDIEAYIRKLSYLANEYGNCNLILSTVPYRYDLSFNSTENEMIDALNSEIRSLCHRNSIHLIDIWYLEPSNYTKHGLHLNKKEQTEHGVGQRFLFMINWNSGLLIILETCQSKWYAKFQQLNLSGIK
ncbi:uncharacterized protein LOC120350849 [Nilaparvata lugens]|uniref:uncharacterized protein LOC120350849 n=1 Tax=Nilaparvata lugens TaxID=108931 RepID=UPI00193DDC59|nr:uncharacterized protein LOC120350849 [Nilaparvata lugens]